MSKGAKIIYHLLTLNIFFIWKWIMNLELKPDMVRIQDGELAFFVNLFTVLFLAITNYLIHQKYLDKDRPNTIR